jgi:dihydroflavonol-4-reductase
MKPTLVTGATGFLGRHMVRTLIAKGHHVRGLVRTRALQVELNGAERYTGDLLDIATLRRAVDGCGLVFHMAADYRLWTQWPDQMYKANVEGTRNLLEAARLAGVERVVYTSTVGCIGIPAGGIGDETTPVSLEEMTGDYKRSKFLAEREALDAARAGLPVVIVNPTAPVGDDDVKPTPTGKVIVDFLKRKLPAYVETGLNLVDVRDTAEGHLLACERGRVGERYILGCENLTLRQIFERLEKVSGVRAPKVRIPYPVALAVGHVSTAIAGVLGSEPLAPLDGVRMAKQKMWVSQDKAVRELGFAPGPVDGALRRAVDWFRSNGYC